MSLSLLQIGLKLILPIIVTGSTGTLIYTLTVPKTKATIQPTITQKEELTAEPIKPKTIPEEPFIVETEEELDALIAQHPTLTATITQKKTILKVIKAEEVKIKTANNKLSEYTKKRDGFEAKIAENLKKQEVLKAKTTPTTEETQELQHLTTEHTKLVSDLRGVTTSIAIISRTTDRSEQTISEEKTKLIPLNKQIEEVKNSLPTPSQTAQE